MKRTLILGFGCIGGQVTSRVLSRYLSPDRRDLAVTPSLGFASIGAATSIAGTVSEALDVDPDDHLRTFVIGFVTGAVLTAFAGPLSRILGRAPAERSDRAGARSSRGATQA